MIAAKCAHCGQDTVLKTGCEVYPHRRDLYELFFWVCIRVMHGSVAIKKATSVTG